MTEQKPVDNLDRMSKKNKRPLPSKWVGLSDEERQEIWWSCEQQTPTTFVKAIEAKLKEKNGA